MWGRSIKTHQPWRNSSDGGLQARSSTTCCAQQVRFEDNNQDVSYPEDPMMLW